MTQYSLTLARLVIHCNWMCVVLLLLVCVWLHVKTWWDAFKIVQELRKICLYDEGTPSK